MSDGPYVLDASALLCLLFREPGFEAVNERLEPAMISTVNLHEVFAKLTDRGVAVDEARQMLDDLDVAVVPVDAEQALLGGALRPTTRAAGLSLGDRSCLALAQARDGVAVTTDRAWRDLDLGITVEVVR